MPGPSPSSAAALCVASGLPGCPSTPRESEGTRLPARSPPQPPGLSHHCSALLLGNRRLTREGEGLG